MSLPNVVIVGAGVTGAVLSTMLKEMGAAVRVVEKSRGAGGRMATHRQRNGGRDTPVVGRADLGAQYITTRSPADHAVLGPIYKSLLDEGVLRPFEGQVAGPNPYGGADETVRHFTAPLGLQSIAEHFLQQSGAEVSWDAAASSLDVLPDGAISLQLKKGTDGTELPPVHTGDTPIVYVFTQPVPQVLGKSKFPLGGNFLQHLNADTAKELEAVEFSSRFAAAYFFEASELKWPHPWAVHYFDKGDIRYISHDTGRRGVTDEPMVSIMVHSGVPLGIELKDEASPFPNATARLEADLAAKLPEVPWEKAAAKKVHKWLYSQVYKGVGGRRPKPDWVWDSGDNGFPGSVELLRGPRSLALLAGDSTAPASNFEGCVFSAMRTAAAIKAFAESQGPVPKSDL